MRERLVVDAQLKLVTVLNNRQRIPGDVEVVVESTLVSRMEISWVTKRTYELFS